MKQPVSNEYRSINTDSINTPVKWHGFKKYLNAPTVFRLGFYIRPTVLHFIFQVIQDNDTERNLLKIPIYVIYHIYYVTVSLIKLSSRIKPKIKAVFTKCFIMYFLHYNLSF